EPGPARMLAPDPLLWNAARGARPQQPAPWLRYDPPETFPPLQELVLDVETAAAVRRLPRAVADGTIRTLLVRGPERSGRRTVVGSIARTLERGLLRVDSAAARDERWQLVGSLAVLTRSLPACVLDLLPTEAAELSIPAGYHGPLAAIIGHSGGLSGDAAEEAVALELGMPDRETRLRHWRAVA